MVKIYLNHPVIFSKKWIIATLFVFSSCSSAQIVDNRFLNLRSSYEITIPGEPWEKIKINNEDLAMRNQESNANFAIISHPSKSDKVTLEALYKQLFIGIKGKSILKKQYVSIDNRRALHAVLEGELDNIKLRINAYIIQAKDVICDIVYWSTPEKFDISLEDFERVVNSFKFTDD